MSKIKYLSIQFDQPFQSYDIPKLRAAIIEKTKRESSLFHNHIDDKLYIYRYPLIQYKIKERKPCLICLADATDDIHYLLKQKDFKFNINGKHYSFEIEDLNLRYHRLQTWDSTFSYSLLHYMALNQENFQMYKQCQGLVAQIYFLEELLQKHVEIFANEMQAYMPFPLQVKIMEINDEKFIEYKGVFHLTFNLVFRTNLDIPSYVGLGKGVSVGFGIVRPLHSQKSRESSFSTTKKRQLHGV
jgi:hypothetical protein